ncbi:MAG: DUF1552 domain-containing protein [Lentisphaeraceae bacterium]|nr:DUF1552 domain-containing protein [Lentisphaeraceae bacterium]
MLDRRNFLKGAGCLLSLPMLESFASVKSLQKAPVRLVNLGYIYGVTKDNNWFPESAGKDYKLTPGLKPLEKHKSDFTFFENIGNPSARDSHYSTTTLFTGANLRRTPGRAFHNSVSCDQIAAKYLGNETRFSSIELTNNETNGNGPGFSLAWNEDGKPVPGIVDPVELFDSLFGDGKMSLAERREMLANEKSILDGIYKESKAIQKKVSTSDKGKLDEYFQSIRHIELKLKKSEDWLNKPKPKAPLPRPTNVEGGVHTIKLMYDLIVAALQTDSTRVISYRQPLASMFKELEISYSVHQISHHDLRPESFEAARLKDKTHAELLSYLIDKLKATKDIDGKTLFDNTVVNFASGVRHAHMLKGVPAIITGGGGGKLSHQGFVKLKEGDNRLSNLWLTSMAACNVPVEEFSDSTGMIEEIWR